MNMSASFDIYLKHFGLSERPFSLLPDPDFLFWSKAHQRAYTMLEYGLMTRAPITLITGEVGAGKTTLLQHLLRNIPEDLTIGLVSNAQGGRGELLRWVLMSLSQSPKPDADYVELFNQFQMYLIEEYAAGRRVVLIFDEAQNLDRESLEELRMFTNINSNKDDVVQLVLVGQPELRSIVRQPSLSQFCQRVSASFHLTAMDAQTVDAYIAHRMARVGAQEQVFTPEATAAIAVASRGIPRLVNQLADFALVYASADEARQVTEETVRMVLQDGVFFADVLRLENTPQ